jgi:asparagine synthase (glutamine-hydrolysing)
MCGITGAINWGNREVLGRMNDVQAHRGPDDAGLWESRLADGTWVGLANRRLAIIDLSPAGHMPMSNDDGTLWITYNGEVYNFPELRLELEGKGHRFRSHTDTEVILRLYEETGLDCVKCLNGMFAFAIWDSRKQHLFLARDHFGIKPLYYTQQGARFGFASEVKSLLELPDCPRQISWEALHRYLTFLWVPDPLTLFDGIFKLPAGHYAVFQGGELRIQQYWDLTFPPADTSYTSDDAALIEEARERFTRVVKSQMVSDVPLGAFLSAGLDSSSVVATMAHVSSEPIQTYTIDIPARHRVGETALDDADVAARTAAHFGCRHTPIVIEPDVVDLLPKLIWHLDEPIATPAVITSYLVSHEARRGVTVLLSGVGGDEVFAGYRKHVAHSLAQWYQIFPGFLRRRVLEPLLLAAPVMRNTPLMGPLRLAKKMARSGSLPPQARFLTDSVYLNEAQKSALYSAKLREEINGFDPFERHLELLKRVPRADFLHQMLYLDTKAFMANLSLTYDDKMSMASSVEVRVPFLDWEFVEWIAQNVPPRLKLKGTTTKYLLRQSMRPWLPREVFKQKKAGFGAPVDYWLAHDMKEMVDDLLSEETLRRQGYFDSAIVRRMVSEHRKGRVDWSMQIWQLLTFQLWIDVFMEKKVSAHQ